MIEAAIFDMDGLMFDTETIWLDKWDDVVEEFGYPSLQAFKDDSLGVNAESQKAVIRKHYGEDVPAEEMFDREEEVVRAALQEHVPLKKGIENLLTWLEAHNIPMAVVSGSEEDVIDICLDTTGVRHYFAHVISTCDLERGKPAPDGFLLAARTLGVAPERALVLEDSFLGVEAGHAGGFVTVMVPDKLAPTPEILAMCDMCCADLDEVVELLEEGRIA